MTVAMVTLIDEFITYLYEQVYMKDIYVLGAQGEIVADILPRIPKMESHDKTVIILEKIKENIWKCPQFCMTKSKAYDCSGLGTDFFIKHKLIDGDTTANGLYKLCDEIKFSEMKPGDMVFQEGKRSDGTLYQHHVGYIAKVENKICLVEAKGRAYGVVESIFDKTKWSHAGRPKFWKQPSPEKYVLTRELYLTDPMMNGEDVQKVQERLNVLSFSCGEADGIFGKKTDIAVRNFQTDAKLDVKRLGTVGKKTAEALGFAWKG